MRPSLPARSSSSSVAIPSSRYKQRHGLGADALKVEQIEDRRRELLQQFLVIAQDAGLDELRILPARSLPMPGTPSSVLLRAAR